MPSLPPFPLNKRKRKWLTTLNLLAIRHSICERLNPNPHQSEAPANITLVLAAFASVSSCKNKESIWAGAILALL